MRGQCILESPVKEVQSMTSCSTSKSYFDDDRNAIEWTTLRTSLAPLVKAICSLEKELFRSCLDHSMQIGIVLLDLGEISLHKGSACSVAMPEQRLKRLDVARKNIDVGSLPHDDWNVEGRGG